MIGVLTCSRVLAVLVVLGRETARPPPSMARFVAGADATRILWVMQDDRSNLLTNAIATGTAARWHGGRSAFIAEGTFDGEGVGLDMQTPQGSWIAVPDISLSAAGILFVELPAGQYRAAVSVDGGTPAPLYAWLVKVRQ